MLPVHTAAYWLTTTYSAGGAGGAGYSAGPCRLSEPFFFGRRWFIFLAPLNSAASRVPNGTARHGNSTQRWRYSTRTGAAQASAAAAGTALATAAREAARLHEAAALCAMSSLGAALPELAGSRNG